MISEYFLVWDYGQITAATPPSTAIIETGSTVVEMVVSNQSPYWLNLNVTNTGQPFWIIAPWSNWPVRIPTTSRIYMSVNTTFAKSTTADASLLTNQQVYIFKNDTVTNVQGQTYTQQIGISGGTIEATFAPGQTVGISGGTVDVGTLNSIATTIDANTTNAFIADNSLILLGSVVCNISNVINGGSAVYNTQVNEAIPITGLYDGVVLIAQSANNYRYTLGIVGSEAVILSPNNTFGYQFIPVSCAFGATEYGTDVMSALGLMSSPHHFNAVSLDITNNNGSTIVSDTLTVWAYAIKTTVAVNNAVTNPVLNQNSVGAFDTPYYFNVVDSTTATTILNSSVGGYIKYMSLFASNGNSAVEGVGFVNGGTHMFGLNIPGGTTANPGLVNNAFPFGTGIANQGITLQMGALSMGVQGYFIVNQTAGAPIPNTLS